MGLEFLDPRAGKVIYVPSLRHLAVLTALAIGAAASGGAQVSPNGVEFQVNTYTTGNQRARAVAVDPQGAFVIVWDSAGSSGTDSDDYSIQGQRFDAHGVPLGAEFQVNSYTTGRQAFPAVVRNAQGSFLVVWQSDGSDGTDTSQTSVQAQFFDANGSFLGGQFQVNSYTTSYQAKPRVGIDGSGDFVVAWISYGSSGTDTSSWSVQARIYDSNGSPLSGEFQVNSYTTSSQAYPAVAPDGAGKFVVVWQSFGSSGNDSDSSSVQAQRFDASGSALGGQFQVNTYTPNSQSEPAVAADTQGNFMVVWHSAGSSGTDSDASSVQAQRFDANGSTLGGQFQVNTYTTGSQIWAAVAADGQGSSVVTWTSLGSGGTDSSGYSVHAQRYLANSAPLGAEFQVNTYTTGDQLNPSAAMDARGNFVVAWESAGSSGTDSDGSSTQAQRYDALFRDGFESGDASRWSSAVP